MLKLSPKFERTAPERPRYEAAKKCRTITAAGIDTVYIKSFHLSQPFSGWNFH